MRSSSLKLLGRNWASWQREAWALHYKFRTGLNKQFWLNFFQSWYSKAFPCCRRAFLFDKAYLWKGNQFHQGQISTWCMHWEHPDSDKGLSNHCSGIFNWKAACPQWHSGHCTLLFCLQPFTSCFWTRVFTEEVLISFVHCILQAEKSKW